MKRGHAWVQVEIALAITMLGIASLQAERKGVQPSPAQVGGDKGGKDIDLDKQLRQAGKELDKIERAVEEWGRASISQVVLIGDEAEPGRFALDYRQPTSNYVERARSAVQGRAAQLLERSLEATLRARASQSELAAASDKLQALKFDLAAARLRQELEAMTNAPPTNAPPSAGTNEPLSAASAATLPDFTASLPGPVNTSNFAGFMRLLGESTVSLSEGDVLKAAASHKMTEQVLNYMSHPIDLPGNHKMFFGLMQVGVSPGWRTKQDYFCEVQVNFEYALSRPSYQARVKPAAGQCTGVGCVKASAGGCAGGDGAGGTYWVHSKSGDGWHLQGGNRQPVVFAAFPFMEAQVFDLQSSYRSQLSLLAELAATFSQVGYNISGEALLRYARRLQKDLATRTVFPLVVPSADATQITYRFDPEAMAMLDPTARRSKAGHSLKPISFPALIVIICEADELENWSHLAAHVETRWVPMSRRHWAQYALVDWWLHGREQWKSLSNQRRLEWAEGFESVTKTMGALKSLGRHTNEVGMELRRRLESLEPLALGRSTYSSLPVPAPTITAVSPKTLRSGLASELRIYGQGFQPPHATNAPLVRLGGVPLRSVTAINHNELTARFEPVHYPMNGLVSGRHTLEVIVQGARGVLSNAVEITPRLEDALPCQFAPPLIVTGVVPERGFSNGPTAILVQGAHFKDGEGRPLVEWVSVGGARCHNIRLLSDKLLTADAPAPRAGGQAAFTTPDNRADLVLATACAVQQLPKAMHFDLEAPPGPPPPKADKDDKGGKADSPEKPSKEVEAAVESLKAAAKALGKGPQVSGAVKILVGEEPKPGAVHQGPGGDQTIIQVGQPPCPAPCPTNPPAAKK